MQEKHTNIYKTNKRARRNRYKERLKTMTIEELYDELTFYTDIRDENKDPNDYIFDLMKDKYDSIDQSIREEYESLYDKFKNLQEDLDIQYQLNPSNNLNYLLDLDTHLYDEWLEETRNLEKKVDNKKKELEIMELKNPELKYYECISSKYNSYNIPIDFSLVRRIIDIKSEIIKRERVEEILKNIKHYDLGNNDLLEIRTAKITREDIDRINYEALSEEEKQERIQRTKKILQKLEKESLDNENTNNNDMTM